MVNIGWLQRWQCPKGQCSNSRRLLGSEMGVRKFKSKEEKRQKMLVTKQLHDKVKHNKHGSMNNSENQLSHILKALSKERQGNTNYHN